MSSLTWKFITWRISRKLEVIFSLKSWIHLHEVSMGWNPGCELKGMSQNPVRGKCNLPALTLSTDPQPKADGILFQSSATVIGRYRPEAVRVIFLWPSLIGILTTVLSVVVDHQSTHMKPLKCDIAITLTMTHGRKSQSANRDLASPRSSAWIGKMYFQ